MGQSMSCLRKNNNLDNLGMYKKMFAYLKKKKKQQGKSANRHLYDKTTVIHIYVFKRIPNVSY